MATFVFTTLDAAETDGPGATFDMEQSEVQQHTLITRVAGDFTEAVVEFQVSHDATNWAVVDSYSVTGPDPEQLTVHVTGRYLRAYLRTLTADPGAAVTTTISSG